MLLLVHAPAIHNIVQRNRVHHAVRGQRLADMRRPQPAERVPRRAPAGARCPDPDPGLRLRRVLHGPVCRGAAAGEVQLQQRDEHDAGHVRGDVSGARVWLRGRRVRARVLLW